MKEPLLALSSRSSSSLLHAKQAFDVMLHTYVEFLSLTG